MRIRNIWCAVNITIMRRYHQKRFINILLTQRKCPEVHRRHGVCSLPIHRAVYELVLPGFPGTCLSAPIQLN